MKCCAMMKGQFAFDKLSLNNKTLLLEDMGTELCSIVFYDHRIYLYEFDNMFIEFYQNIESRKVEVIKVAKYGDLDKFTHQITVSSLLIQKEKFKSGKSWL